MTPVDPRGLVPREWCDRTGARLTGLSVVMVTQDDGDWQRWGALARQLLGRQLPDPYGYAPEEFVQWAQRFNQTVSTQ